LQYVNAIGKQPVSATSTRRDPEPEREACPSLDLRARFGGGAVYLSPAESDNREPLLPCGLHTIGKTPTAEEAIATTGDIAASSVRERLRRLPA